MNVFHISVCPSSHPWHLWEGEQCCSKEVKDGHCGGEYIRCQSSPCASGKYMVFVTFVSVCVCFRYTVGLFLVLNWNWENLKVPLPESFFQDTESFPQVGLV